MTERIPQPSTLPPASPSSGGLRPSLANVTTVIRPPGRWPGLGLSEAWRYRSICVVLAKRSIKVRYRQTAIGITWALIQPLVMAIIFTVFFGLLARLPTENVPFPLYYFAGLAIWHVSMRILGESTSSVTGNSALVNRVHFPRVFFPFAVTLASSLDLAVNGIVLLLMMVWFGFPPTLSVLVAPLLAFIAYTTVVGAGLWLSALNVSYRDVGLMLPLLVQIWFFITPLIYPATLVPEHYLTLYYLNPMALVVTGMRWAMLGTTPPPTEAWPIGILISSTIFATGYLFFRSREPMFSDAV